MHSDKSRKKAMTIAVQTSGVKSATIKGDDQTQLEVTGETVDISKLVSKIRKKVGYAELVTVGHLDGGEKNQTKPNTTTTTTAQPQPLVGVRLPDYYVCEVPNDHVITSPVVP
ncbi:hypothetical protein ACOSQ3_002984 [Xanthoceras sorbifolium]